MMHFASVIRLFSEPKGAAIVSSAYCHVFVLAENPDRFVLAEPLLTKRLLEQIEKEGNNPPIARFRHANGETREQSLLIDEEDALMTFDGEDVTAPISDYRWRGRRHHWWVVNIGQQL